MADGGSLEERVMVIERRQSAYEAKLVENTAITCETKKTVEGLKETVDAAKTDLSELLDIFRGAKTGVKIFGKIGSGVKWIGGIAASLWAIWLIAKAIIDYQASLPPPQ